MKRRAFLLGTAGALAVTGMATAQQRNPRGTIGYLHYRTLNAANTTLILREAWTQLGYVEGQTVHLRAAEGDSRRVAALAEELVRLGAGVLIVVGAEAVRAAKQALPDTPIVAIDLETDPVRAGLASSFAKPGGNVTGLFLDLPSLAGKWIQLLRELDPRIERIAFSWDASTGRDQLDVALVVARDMGVATEVVETTSYDFATAFQQLRNAKRIGIVQLTSPGFGAFAKTFVAEITRNRWPAIGFLKIYAELGMPIAYGPNQEGYFARAADIADRVLAGARVADIPIEQPTKFELSLNLKTLRAIGIEVPTTLLARADEVIE